jgi:hypothetical protein
MNRLRLPIVQHAQVGLDFDKDVEEAIGREIHSSRLLGDPAQRLQARRFVH